MPVYHAWFGPHSDSLCEHARDRPGGLSPHLQTYHITFEAKSWNEARRKYESTRKWLDRNNLRPWADRDALVDNAALLRRTLREVQEKMTQLQEDHAEATRRYKEEWSRLNKVRFGMRQEIKACDQSVELKDKAQQESKS